jgi:hypothetical protein
MSIALGNVKYPSSWGVQGCITHTLRVQITHQTPCSGAWRNGSPGPDFKPCIQTYIKLFVLLGRCKEWEVTSTANTSFWGMEDYTVRVLSTWLVLLGHAGIAGSQRGKALLGSWGSGHAEVEEMEESLHALAAAYNGGSDDEYG